MIANPSRRQFIGGLAAAGMTATGCAAGAFGGMAAALARPGPGRRLNIYSWQGYASAGLLEPFRAEFDCRFGVESLTSDPEAITRLRGGETDIWDLIVVNAPWPRKVLHPEHLILPLDTERYANHFDSILPALRWRRPQYGANGSDLLGLAQRFAPFGFAVNTDRISKAMAEDQGFQLFLDPAMQGRYGLLAFDSWNITQICIAAGIDPFRPHSPVELELFAETAARILAGAGMRSDDIGAINLALAQGDIDACFTGSVSIARLAGLDKLRAVIPNTGPIDGKGGVLWVEIMSVVNNPRVSSLAYDFLDYVQRPEAAHRIALAVESCNPVAQMGDRKVFEQFSKIELDALQWDGLDEELSRCADYDINPDYGQMLAIYNNAKRILV
jgi:spermidine/putrescine transport system substrate-binding protein